MYKSIKYLTEFILKYIIFGIFLFLQSLPTKFVYTFHCLNADHLSAGLNIDFEHLNLDAVIGSLYGLSTKSRLQLIGKPLLGYYIL